jgi:hypothetical protein
MHARECLRLAQSATREGARETFSKLANTWLSLAAELERNQALLETWGVKSDTSPTAGLNPPEVAPTGYIASTRSMRRLACSIASSSDTPATTKE